MSMPVVFPTKPKLLRAVPKPATVAPSEIAQAETVYIDGLAAGSGPTQAQFDALAARVATLEADAGSTT